MLGRVIAMLLTLALLAVAAGCGEDEGGGAPQEESAAPDAKVVDVASMENAEGEVTFCTGKDTSGDRKEAIEMFNEEFGSQGLEAKMLEFPESADEQRNQFVQRQEAKSGDCDVFYSDVIWTAEFASQGWLYEMGPYVQDREQELIPSTVETVKYDGRTWGMPKQTDSAFLYYRTDQVDSPPDTWQQVYELAAQENGIVYQGASYEGLTCDFLEIAFAAGGRVLSDDGKEAQFDSPENVAALQFMVDGIKNGAAPKAVTTYMEEPARQAFESGDVTFMRNWPYAYALGLEAPKIKGKFDVAPLPSWEGGEAASILGGHNLVISAFSENPGAALKLIDYMTSEEITEARVHEVLARTDDRRDLRPARRQEGASVRAGAEAGGRAGPAAPGVAGVSADLAGDLQERQPGAVGADEPGGSGQAGAVGYRGRAGDVLRFVAAVFERGAARVARCDVAVVR